MRIAALGRGTHDLIVTATDNLVDAILRRHSLKCEGVQFFGERTIILDIIKDLQRSANTRWASGGTISNTLFAVATCFSQLDSAAPELFWLGSAEYSDFAGQSNPIDSLRRVSVVPICSPAMQGNRIAISVISAQTGEVKAILIFDSLEPVSFMSDWPTVDVLLTSVAEIARADDSLFDYISSAKSLAVLIADCSSITNETKTRLLHLAKSDKLKWMVGQFADFSRLSFLDHGAPKREYNRIELVGTAGSEPVRVWDVRRSTFEVFPVDPLHKLRGNVLGAGDAYAGGFLAGRILGWSLDQAHERGHALAAKTLDSHLATFEVHDDLNQVFGHYIDRTSNYDNEGEIYERIRHAPGIVVTSCGQTGVDQLALRSASKLGLPCFAILPSGRRTESSEGLVPDEDDFGDAYVIELGSTSYRYCTWANVYLSDGTLLWDFHNSEGSQATREACQQLRRPCLDITRIDPDRLPLEIIGWATKHNIRVINFAGNRSRLLSATERTQVERQTDYALRCLAWNWAHLSAGIVTPLHLLEDDALSFHSYDHLRIGVSKDTLTQHMLYRFLSDIHGLPPGHPRKLYQEFTELGLTLVFARARDLPAMIQRSLVDVIICGSDLLDEAELDCSILVRTGTHPCHIVMVGTQKIHSSDAARSHIRVGSQYPSLSLKLMKRMGYRNASVMPILGAAEAWIMTGYLDAAIDTWRTGYTASLNGLTLLKIFYSTALVVATLADNNLPAIHRFKTMFEHWLITSRD